MDAVFYIVPIVITVWFWVKYLGYYLSAIPLLLGFVWVAFDKRKQGFHDKLAGTFVVRDPASGPAGSN